jgi:hypothetical protein
MFSAFFMISTPILEASSRAETTIALAIKSCGLNHYILALQPIERALNRIIIFFFEYYKFKTNGFLSYSFICIALL